MDHPAVLHRIKVGPSLGQALERSRLRFMEIGGRDHAKLHHIHGCAQVTATNQKSTAFDFAGAGHRVCEVRGKQGVEGKEQDSWAVSVEAFLQ